MPLGDRLCALGRYGRRSGAGWYDYTDGQQQPDAAVTRLIEDYVAEVGLTRPPIWAGDIHHRLLAVMANEGARIVEDGIADSTAVVDVVKTAGYGFPRWRGGPMHWAESVGDVSVKQALDALDAASPGAWVRAAIYQ